MNGTCSSLNPFKVILLCRYKVDLVYLFFFCGYFMADFIVLAKFRATLEK